MSLRARVLAGLAFVAVMLASVLWFITDRTEDNLLAQVDEQLDAAVQPVRDVELDFDGARRPPEVRPSAEDRQPPPERGDAPNRRRETDDDLSNLFVGLVDGDAVVPLVTPGLLDDDDELPVVQASRAVAEADAGAPFTVHTSGDGVRFRARAYLDDGDVVVLALPLRSVDDAVDDLVAVAGVGAAAILVALGAVGWWVVRLGVRPVQQMTGVATAIAGGDLSHRVPETTGGTEAATLGRALNQMLQSIELSFDERVRAEERLRQFVADASHELRTPVATIRGYAELYRVGALQEQAQLDDAMRRTEEEAVRMGGLVEDLLQLARLDQGRPLESAPVDLAAVVRDAAADARARQPGRDVRVDHDTAETPTGHVAGGAAAAERPVVVHGDDARIRQIVANLCSNALVHTPPTAEIRLGAAIEGRQAVVTVSDDGDGMEPAIAERVFERFFRADASRARHQGGSGLGLSIVRAVTEAHGGQATLTSKPGSGTTVRLTFPLDAPPSGTRAPTTTETTKTRTMTTGTMTTGTMTTGT